MNNINQEFTESVAHLHSQPPQSTPKVQEIDWQERALQAEKKLESLELVALYAEQIIKAWPNISFRTLRSMCKMMDDLKEALNNVSSKTVEK